MFASYLQGIELRHRADKNTSQGRNVQVAYAIAPQFESVLGPVRLVSCVLVTWFINKT